MRPAIPAALALAGLCACYSGPAHVPPGSDAGDAGQDGGPDAGDAGCVALTLPGVPAIDGCHGSAATSATGTVNLANCSIDITIPTFAGPCSGFVHGATDAFDGGCESGSYACTSASLPGDLTCVFAGGLCAIRICDAGASCP